MLVQRPDRLLRMLLGWTAVTLLFAWLPLIRGPMDGASYVWGASYWGLSVGGSGSGGDYWLLVVQGIVGLSILALGWRGARPPFHVLLLLWHGVLGTSAVYSAYTDPDPYRFRGDTLGIDISLAWVGPLFLGGFFLLAVLWTCLDLRRTREFSSAGDKPRRYTDREDTLRDVPTRTVAAWTRTNTSWLAVLMLLLPVQFVLLRFGEPHGLTDRIGVVLTIIQCLTLGRIFRPAAARNGPAPLAKVAAV